MPVSSLSRLTSEALTAASSLDDEVRAVTVCYPDPEDRVALHALERSRSEWDPGAELVRLTSDRRSLGRPIAAYVHEVAGAEPGTRVTVLIAERSRSGCGSGCRRTSGERSSRTPCGGRPTP